MTAAAEISPELRSSMLKRKNHHVIYQDGNQATFM